MRSSSVSALSRLADWFAVSREIRGQALHHAGEIEHSEKDQHQGDTELHGEAETRWDDHPEEDDQAADGKDRQRVTESPDGADQACTGGYSAVC